MCTAATSPTNGASASPRPCTFAAIGGYGLFGVIVTARLRLTRRHLVQRIVEVMDIDDLPSMFEQRIAAGFEYGDFQFATELTPDALMRKGVFSCYRPVD